MTAISPVHAGVPVDGSIRWWAKWHPGRAHSLASMPDVATPPARRWIVCATSPVRGWRTRTSHGVPRLPPTRTSPPQSTAQRPWRSSRVARRSATQPLTEPLRSSWRPGGRRITPAASSTSTLRHRAAGSGRPGRRCGAESSARSSEGAGLCARDSRYPARSTAPSTVGSTSPSLICAASSAAPTAARSRGPAGTHSRGSAFRRERSLPESKRESRRSTSANTDAASTSPSASRTTRAMVPIVGKLSSSMGPRSSLVGVLGTRRRPHFRAVGLLQVGDLARARLGRDRRRR